jgi:hypothetical protein
LAKITFHERTTAVNAVKVMGLNVAAEQGIPMLLYGGSAF